MWSLIDQLVQQGVTDFFIASGSRSTPLVLAAARHPKARIYRHFDERGLGFYALGCALAKETPVAVIATSGTAIGNLLPAVMEAHHASIPLILLTADRPSELRDTCANQTTDQAKMFQNFVRWQFDFEPSMPDAAVRSQAAHAVFRALSPQPGPVQLNCALREPLYPQEIGSESRAISLHLGDTVSHQRRKLPPRGVIFLGRLPKRSDTAAVLSLARRLQWPVCADILSGARLTPTEEQLRSFNWLEPPTLDCILHFGERMTSKRVLSWESEEYIHVSPHPTWFDPAQRITERFHSSIEAACLLFEADTNPAWLSSWKDRDPTNQIQSLLAPGSESYLFHSLSSLSLDEWGLFLGTSMPVREADWFLFPKKARAFFSNRGLSGIDGNIATAVGLAQGLNAPILALVGDLTALHDLNSLALLKASPQPIVLLISNNGGGGIFSHLAVAKDPRFEELFAFQHDLSFEGAAQMFGLPYEKDIETAIRKNQSCIVELITSRQENHLFHQKLKEVC